MSPGTTSALGMVRSRPALSTVQRACVMTARAATARSARDSCTIPRAAFSAMIAQDHERVDRETDGALDHPGDERDHDCGKEQADQRIRYLADHPSPQWWSTSRAKSVRPVAHLSARQPRHRRGPDQDRRPSRRRPCRHPWRTHRASRAGLCHCSSWPHHRGPKPSHQHACANPRERPFSRNGPESGTHGMTSSAGLSGSRRDRKSRTR